MRININGKYFQFDGQALEVLNTILASENAQHLKEKYNNKTEQYEYTPSGEVVTLKAVTTLEWSK